MATALDDARSVMEFFVPCPYVFSMLALIYNVLVEETVGLCTYLTSSEYVRYLFKSSLRSMDCLNNSLRSSSS